MANPAPEITQEEIHAMRPDAIMATAEGLADAVREIEEVNAANTPHPAAFSARDSTARTFIALPPRPIRLFGTGAGAWSRRRHGDGATRKSACVPDIVNHVFDARVEDGAVGMTALLHKGHVVLIADTLGHEWPGTRGLAVVAACKVG